MCENVREPDSKRTLGTLRTERDQFSAASVLAFPPCSGNTLEVSRVFSI